MCIFLKYVRLSQIFVFITGDINGDGVDDILISALKMNAYFIGSAHVIYGTIVTRQSFSVADLTATQGFVLTCDKFSWFGYSVSGAGNI